IGESTFEEARSDLSDLDTWLIRFAQRVEIGAADVAVATMFLRRLDLPLLTPDAIHIAITQRLNATLVTFDRQMATSARALGTAVAIPGGLSASTEIRDPVVQSVLLQRAGTPEHARGSSRQH